MCTCSVVAVEAHAGGLAMLATIRQAPANLLAVEVRSNQRQNENGYHRGHDIALSFLTVL